MARRRLTTIKKKTKQGQKRRKKRRRGRGFRLLVGAIVLLGVASLLAFLLWPDLSSNSSARKRRRRLGALSGALFITCNLNGRIVPCGCEEGELGGIARAAAVFDTWEEERSDHIVVDVGNATIRSHEAADTVNRFTFDALERLGCAVVNCGVNEVMLPLDKLVALAKGRSLQLISANFVHADTAKPVLPPHLVLARGGLRIAFIGLVDDQFAWPDRPQNVRLVPPEEALAREIPAVKEQAEVIVVLAFLRPEKLYELAQKFPDVALFIGGRTTVSSGTAETTERSAIAYLGDEGCSVARLSFDMEHGERPHIEFITKRLDEDVKVPAASPMAKLVGRFTKALDGKPLPGADWNPTMPCTGSFVGSGVCSMCHPKEFMSWYGGQHSGAYATLLLRGQHRDPACLGCHTTGYGRAGGFAPDPVDPLMKRLRSRRAADREAAADKLVKLSPLKSVPELLLALASGNEQFRTSAYNCLERISARKNLSGGPKAPTDYDPKAGPTQRDAAVSQWRAWWRVQRERLVSPLLRGQRRSELPSTKYPLAGVGCEACHGGARRHLGEALKHLKTPEAIGFEIRLRPSASPRHGAACHHPERPCLPDGQEDAYTKNDTAGCTSCEGVGKVNRTTCEHCKGTGKANGAACKHCQGTGKVGGDPCERCAGSGKVNTRTQYLETIKHWGEPGKRSSFSKFLGSGRAPGKRP